MYCRYLVTPSLRLAYPTHFSLFWQTQEEKEAVQMEPYPKHLVTTHSMFQLYTVEVTRNIPIDSSVGFHAQES